MTVPTCIGNSQGVPEPDRELNGERCREHPWRYLQIGNNNCREHLRDVPSASSRAMDAASGTPSTSTERVEAAHRLLKVKEAAAEMRVCTSHAYELAHEYLNGGGTAGLPVLWFGTCMRGRAGLRGSPVRDVPCPHSRRPDAGRDRAVVYLTWWTALAITAGRRRTASSSAMTG